MFPIRTVNLPLRNSTLTGKNYQSATTCIIVLNGRDCEKKLIEEIVKPGGVRIKPTDGMLGDFAKEAKGMDVPIIGSLLISVLEVSNPYGF